jgi:hypothetical protein
MVREKRQFARVALTVRVVLADGSTAVTRDVSATGIYLLAPPRTIVGNSVSFEYDEPAIGLKYIATCETVRVERMSHGTGVALKFHECRLDRLMAPDGAGPRA